MTAPRPLSSLLIAGGGPAGWGFAALLSQRLQGAAPEISVMETGAPTIPDIVSTLPSIRTFHAALGLADADAIRRCSGSFKLGERFEDFSGAGSSAFLPYGEIGAGIGPVRFHQQLARLSDGVSSPAYAEYALATRAAADNRFAPPAKDPRSFLSTLDYGFHLDADAYTTLLREIAVRNGVKVLHDEAGAIDYGNDGRIASIRLTAGEPVAADFFVDATPDGRIVRKLCSGGWRADPPLPFDRVACMRRPQDGTVPPFTTNRAMPAGWLRQIPLAGSLHNKLTFASDYLDDGQASAMLGSDSIDFADHACGFRPAPWQANCLAIGPAAWRLDPLAAADMHLVASAGERFMRLLPHAGSSAAEASEYNRLFCEEIATARDFARLFQRCQSRGEPVWKAARKTPVSNELAHALALFESRGRIARRENLVHDETRWIAAFLAMGVRPRNHDPQAGALGRRALTERTARIAEMARQSAESMPGHDRMLARIAAGGSTP
ncbi:tryptophan 7-halogenase [Maricaulis sp.]|uniref:tryptophan 7-halogenase n=1 Tax=Maricaulis sp. TaxID=1486257 RepID=UPI0026335625|nr:tryptophan 7-halogenase [Maricaulis sp.]